MSGVGDGTSVAVGGAVEVGGGGAVLVLVGVAVALAHAADISDKINRVEAIARKRCDFIYLLGAA
jgi:hypothetical protein